MKDSIEKEVLIAASPERVWEVITTPQHINRWLWDSADIDLRIGGKMAFVSTCEGEIANYEATIEQLDPPHVFAFRWAEGGWVPGGSTRIVITLSAEGAGTRLRLVESGFASLDISDELRAELFNDIKGGWGGELAELVDYVAQLSDASAS
jgi:uncharacterized protein YndB with AHSA1/START domain